LSGCQRPQGLSAEDLDKVGKTFGVENFTDLIADETNGTDITSVQAFMEKVSHPALTMWDITTPSEEAAAVDAARGAVVQAAASGGGPRPPPSPIPP